MVSHFFTVFINIHNFQLNWSVISRRDRAASAKLWQCVCIFHYYL